MFGFRRIKIITPLDSLDISSLKSSKALAKKHGSSKLVVSTDDLRINLNEISSYAMRVVATLQKHHYEAYLVGGCIRDLLLGKKPKDFDVSTNATPEQIRQIFVSNSRIIGRRFKIVHVLQGKEIIEVTTFRSNKVAPSKPHTGRTRVKAESGMLIRDNVYGKNIIEDSQRRDFTINALYLDPVKKVIYDFNGGLYDMQQGVIDIIGDPETRYSEDPVRMIRALRFCAKLGFKISRRTLSPIKKMSSNLNAVSNARMFEEVNKLFLTGHGLQTFRTLRKYNIFELLFPAAGELLDNQNYINFVEYALGSSDKRYQEDKRNMPHFLYAVILWAVFQKRMFISNQTYNSAVVLVPQNKLISGLLNDIITEQNRITDMPMAVADSIRSLWRMQLTLDDIENCNVDEIAARNIFRASYDFLTLRGKFEPYLKSAVNFWEPYYIKSKELADKRKAKKEELILGRKARKKEKLAQKKRAYEEKLASKKSKRKANEESFDDEANLSAKRKKQLEKARAWRAAMHLDVK